MPHHPPPHKANTLINPMKKIIGIVKSSPYGFIPLNVACAITITKTGQPIGIHRLDNGVGAYLFNEEVRKNTIYEEIGSIIR